MRIDGTDAIREDMTNVLRGVLNQGSSSGQVPIPNQVMIQGYVETLTRYADEQRESSPPPAAEQLNVDLVTAFEAYSDAMNFAVSLATGVSNPLAEAGLRGVTLTSFGDGDAAMERAASLANTFLVRCSSTPLPTPTPLSVSPGGVTTGPMYPLSIQFVDGSGALLPGGCVELVAPLGTGITCDNDQGDGSPTEGVIEVRGSPWTYRVRETEPPPGYEAVAGVRTVELTTAGATLVLVHEEA